MRTTLSTARTGRQERVALSGPIENLRYVIETRDAAVTCLKSWSKCTRNPAPAAYQVYVKPY
jgi:hypothetical protein